MGLMTRASFLCTALMLIAACAPYNTHTIHYLRRAGNVPEVQYDATSDVYVLIDEDTLPEGFDSLWFGRAISLALAENTGFVGAFRTTPKPDENDSFLTKLKPRGLTFLKLRSSQ